MDDDQFMQQLQNLTCDAVDWSGFDPSKWRREETDDWNTSDGAKGQEGDGYASDASILSARHLDPSTLKPSTRPTNSLRIEDVSTDDEEGYRDASDLENIKWPEVSVKQGEIDPTTEVFTPWRMVQEYPNLYVGKRNGERVSRILLVRDDCAANRLFPRLGLFSRLRTYTKTAFGTCKTLSTPLPRQYVNITQVLSLSTL